MTAPRPGRERPVHVEPLHAFAERWLALARRYKIAMVGVAGAAIAVYCPQNPFQSARAKHAHLGGHYPSRYNTSDTRCSFARLGCQEVGVDSIFRDTGAEDTGAEANAALS
jgi:hypothetical protein